MFVNWLCHLLLFTHIQSVEAPFCADHFKEQTVQYQQAQTAIQTNQHLTNLLDLKRQYQSNPLFPYLHYQFLVKHLGVQKPGSIIQFFAEYDMESLESKLLDQWLLSLAKNQRWKMFIEFYKPSNKVSLKCYYVHALLKNNQKNLAYQLIPSLWLVGYPQPNNCQFAFDTWIADGQLTKAQLWSRIELSILNEQIKLARYLISLLPKNEQSIGLTWILLDKKPELVNELNFDDTPIQREMLLYSIKKLATTQPDKAATFWKKALTKYSFSPQQKTSVIRKIALFHSIQDHPNTLAWFDELEIEEYDKTTAEARVRHSLKKENWSDVKNFIEKLPKKEKRQSTLWKYWYARALEEVGNKQESKKIFSTLAKELNYYGILAHFRLGKKLQFTTNYELTDFLRTTQIFTLPEVQRSYLLRLLNKENDAKLEWRDLMEELTVPEKLAATQILANWRWYQMAIENAKNLPNEKAYAAKFPLAYNQFVLNSAKRFNLKPAILFAIIRQESRFNSKAKSYVGALGLMQLMPKTGKWLANRLNLVLRFPTDLLIAKKNIQVGAFYYKNLLSTFDNQYALATASYNAGPNIVKKWINTNKNSLDYDVFVEIIPFHETRHYVKKVFTNFVIYQFRLDQQTTPEVFFPEED